MNIDYFKAYTILPGFFFGGNFQKYAQSFTTFTILCFILEDAQLSHDTKDKKKSINLFLFHTGD